MARLTIRGLQKYYGKVHALRGIDLDIAEGEFCVFVGPSGCGKSTLLRTIAGLEEIDGGTIAIGGEPIDGVPPRDRNIAMVFQNYALYPYLNVFENIAFGLRARKFAEAEIEPRVDRAAAMLGIEPPARAPAARAVGRPAPARRHRPRHRPRRRACSCSTSRCPTSTPSSATGCAPRSSGCTRRSARPRSTSPTTRSRP